LYEGDGLNIKDLLRAGMADSDLQNILTNAISHRAKDGWEAEAERKASDPAHESMASIGG
jgi:molybdenum cofactor biosynthesis enzyme MoaA